MKKYWIAIAVIIIIGAALQHFLGATGSGTPSTTPRPGAPAERISVTTDTGSWQEYANNKLGFSASVPPGASVRGTAESDLAIFTLSASETGGKQAMVTLTKKKTPLNQEPYADIAAFWADEQRFVAAQGGVTSNERFMEVNGRSFFEVKEGNRQNNYMGLHRYLYEGGAFYEITLTIEGDLLEAKAVERLNEVAMTFTVK